MKRLLKHLETLLTSVFKLVHSMSYVGLGQIVMTDPHRLPQTRGKSASPF